jgi:catechol 2,3-dioxygenase-like lactoylglutathione lyase family enzyme
MKPRITVITIGVDNLDRAVSFYRDGLGLPTDGVFGSEFEHGAVCFFKLEGGLILAVWPRRDLAWDCGLPVSPRSPTEFSLGHNLSSREQVDATVAQARAAGATVVKEPQETFWGGYASYIQDPDGHLWEILWNSAIEVPD